MSNTEKIIAVLLKFNPPKCAHCGSLIDVISLKKYNKRYFVLTLKKHQDNIYMLYDAKEKCTTYPGSFGELKDIPTYIHAYENLKKEK